VVRLRQVIQSHPDRLWRELRRVRHRASSLPKGRLEAEAVAQQVEAASVAGADDAVATLVDDWLSN